MSMSSMKGQGGFVTPEHIGKDKLVLMAKKEREEIMEEIQKIKLTSSSPAPVLTESMLWLSALDVSILLCSSRIFVEITGKKQF